MTRTKLLQSTHLSLIRPWASRTWKCCACASLRGECGVHTHRRKQRNRHCLYDLRHHWQWMTHRCMSLDKKSISTFYSPDITSRSWRLPNPSQIHIKSTKRPSLTKNLIWTCLTPRRLTSEWSWPPLSRSFLSSQPRISQFLLWSTRRYTLCAFGDAHKDETLRISDVKETFVCTYPNHRSHQQLALFSGFLPLLSQPGTVMLASKVGIPPFFFFFLLPFHPQNHPWIFALLQWFIIRFTLYAFDTVNKERILCISDPREIFNLH